MDIEDIRRRLDLGHLDFGYWYQQVTALCDRVEALETSAEHVVDAHTLGGPIDEPIAHLAALLFDGEESRNG